jgi:predicted dienelactone hydrolase
VNFRLALTVSFAFLLVAGCSGDDDAATTEPIASTTTTVIPESTVRVTRAPATTAPPTSAPVTTAPATTAPATTSLPTIEPAVPFTPLAAGEFEVGVSTVVLEDAERPLTVDIWFPIGTADGLAPHQYTLLPGVYYESPDAFTATADQLAQGAFPLVIYSHGSGGLRYIDSAFNEAIASHGYVVAAADHTGNTAVDRLIAGVDAAPDEDREPTEEEIRQFEQIGLNRANDVSRLIDALTDPNSVAGPIAANVDADAVAVVGHSAGGSTATAMTIGITNDTGTFESDERVDAIALLAPAVSRFTEEQLAALEVPMMSIVGTADDVTPAEPNGTRLWNLTDQSPAYRIELQDAGHYAFTDICSYQTAVPTLPDVPQPIIDLIDSYAEFSCTEENMPPERADELTDTYVITFLDEVLRGGPSVVDATGTPPDDVTVFEAR